MTVAPTTRLPTAKPIVIKRIFPCDKRALFDAWSKPSIMSIWFYAGKDKCQNSTVTNSFSVGGAYSVTMHGPDRDHHIHGVYRKIVRYTHISFSWTSAMATDSLVELEFKEVSPNRTELTLLHTDLPSRESWDAHDAGWSRCLQNLDEYLNAPTTPAQQRG